jgi:hypothetical protein
MKTDFHDTFMRERKERQRQGYHKNKTIQFSSDVTFRFTTFSWKFFNFDVIDEINEAEK